jgi:hypothetical protein
MDTDMEPRSFKKPQGPAVGEVARIDPKGLTPDQKLDAVLEQGNQLHGCLEQHIAASRLAELRSSDWRRAADEKFESVTSVVGALDTRTDILEGSVGALAQALGGQVATGTVKVQAPTSWKDIFKIAGAVGGLLGLFIFLFQLAARLWGPFVAYMMGLSPT